MTGGPNAAHPWAFDPDLILLNMITIAGAAGVVIVTEWTHAVAYHRVALGSILSALPRCDGSGPSRRVTPRVAQLGGKMGGTTILLSTEKSMRGLAISCCRCFGCGVQSEINHLSFEHDAGSVLSFMPLHASNA